MKENKDNWLEKELKREKSISAWDLDETSKVRAEHEENCERENNAKRHKELHLLNDKIDESLKIISIIQFLIPIIFLILYFFLILAN